MFFAERNFAFPQELGAAISSTIWNSTHPAPPELDRVGRRLKALWPMLAKERGQQEQNHYSFSHDAAEAYAAYYVAANAMKLPLILEEMRLLDLHLPTQTNWLDLGAGPGTTLAGLSWWSAKRGQNIKLLSLEQSKLFIELGERLGQNLAAQIPGMNLNSSWRREDATAIASILREHDPQVISLSNSFGEIAPSPTAKEKIRQELVHKLDHSAQKSGTPHWLIIIEPASQLASRELLLFRQQLLADPRCKIWLPCLSERACGALADPKDWCHEEAACEFPNWHNNLGALAGLQKQSLLFSYLVVSVGIHPTVSWSNNTAKRIVSQRLEQKGQTVCYLCTQNGKQKIRVQHSKAHEQNRHFLNARRGELFADVQYAEKGDVLSYSPLLETAGLATDLFPIPSTR